MVQERLRTIGDLDAGAGNDGRRAKGKAKARKSASPEKQRVAAAARDMAAAPPPSAAAIRARPQPEREDADLNAEEEEDVEQAEATGRGRGRGEQPRRGPRAQQFDNDIYGEEAGPGPSTAAAAAAALAAAGGGRGRAPAEPAAGPRGAPGRARRAPVDSSEDESSDDDDYGGGGGGGRFSGGRRARSQSAGRSASRGRGGSNGSLLSLVSSVLTLRSCGECPPGGFSGGLQSGPVRVQAPRMSRRGPPSVAAHSSRTCSILGPPAIEKPRVLTERERILERLPDPYGGGGGAQEAGFDPYLESRAPTRQTLRSTDHELYNDAEDARPRSDDEDDRPLPRGGNFRGGAGQWGGTPPGRAAGRAAAAPQQGTPLGFGGRAAPRVSQQSPGFSPAKQRVPPPPPRQQQQQRSAEGMHSSDSENDGVSERRLAKAWGGGGGLGRGSGGGRGGGPTTGKPQGQPQSPWPPPPGQSPPPLRVRTSANNGSPQRGGGGPRRP